MFGTIDPRKTTIPRVTQVSSCVFVPDDPHELRCSHIELGFCYLCELRERYNILDSWVVVGTMGAPGLISVDLSSTVNGKLGTLLRLDGLMTTPKTTWAIQSEH